MSSVIKFTGLFYCKILNFYGTILIIYNKNITLYNKLISKYLFMCVD